MEHEYLVLNHSKDLKFLFVKVNENLKITLTERSEKQISDMLSESLTSDEPLSKTMKAHIDKGPENFDSFCTYLKVKCANCSATLGKYFIT